MKILFLAPHPFYQTRGTPIDVYLVLKVLAGRRDTRVDLVTYHEGEDVRLDNLTIYRIPSLRFIKNVKPGFSLKKLLCDLFLFMKAWRLIRKERYDLIHAGEESVFMAMFFKKIYSIPYVYDLDSSLAQQIVEQNSMLQPFSRIFDWLEGLAIRKSLGNLPVCNALAELCKRKGSKKIVTLHDISQLKHIHGASNGKLRNEIGIQQGMILLYSGNLEPYQGVDLLLESFKLACMRTDKNIHLAIIGGMKSDIDHYIKKARQLKIDDRVHFLGPRPFEDLSQYICDADILVSPRIKGINTPMKVFPYLHSGKPVLATDLYTHNQILSRDVAFLAPAEPKGFADGIVKLVEDRSLRQSLGLHGKAFVERNHTYEAYSKKLNGFYDWLEDILKPLNNRKIYA